MTTVTVNHKRNTAGAWALFILSSIGIALLFMFMTEWFWVALPGTLTGFALLMDWL